MDFLEQPSMSPFCEKGWNRTLQCIDESLVFFLLENMKDKCLATGAHQYWLPITDEVLKINCDIKAKKLGRKPLLDTHVYLPKRASFVTSVATASNSSRALDTSQIFLLTSGALGHRGSVLCVSVCV